ncbi:MAG: hypothetical protein Q3995_01360 [Eubacteriales bacterium]|nr:hypothetical protein [Eubacteriales bacterium]
MKLKKHLPQDIVSGVFLRKMRIERAFETGGKKLEKYGKNPEKALKTREKFFLHFLGESNILRASSGAKW